MRGLSCSEQMGKKSLPHLTTSGKGWDHNEVSSSSCSVLGLEKISVSQKHLGASGSTSQGQG